MSNASELGLLAVCLVFWLLFALLIQLLVWIADRMVGWLAKLHGLFALYLGWLSSLVGCISC